MGVKHRSTLCQLQDAEIMNKFVAIAMALIAALTGVAQANIGNGNDILENASALLTRQQQRMDILEAGLRKCAVFWKMTCVKSKSRSNRCRVAAPKLAVRRRRINCVARPDGKAE